MDVYIIKPAHNREEIHTANLSFDFHHPAHLSGGRSNYRIFTDFQGSLNNLLCFDYHATGHRFKRTSKGMESLKKTLKCLHCDLTRRERLLILMMAVGFVSRKQQVSCRIMRPLSRTRQRIWQGGRATGELADILDRTQKDMGRERQRPGGETKAEENCKCYEGLWIRCCHRYFVAFPIGKCG